MIYDATTIDARFDKEFAAYNKDCPRRRSLAYFNRGFLKTLRDSVDISMTIFVADSTAAERKP